MKLSICILASIFFISCNNVSKEKLTVIDNIVLGLKDADNYKQMDSLLIKHKYFCTKLFWTGLNDIISNDDFINIYYTEAFNFSKFRSDFNDHIGLLSPMGLDGNIIGITVILGHTSVPLTSGVASEWRKTLTEKVFYQDVNIGFIEDIKNLYISKYGQPSDTFSMKNHNIYVIEGKKINQYGDPEREGLNIKWETENFTIEFFTGLPSYDSKYNSFTKYYDDQFYNQRPRDMMPIDPFKHEVQCNTYSFIQYRLKPETIKRLKLENNTKI